MRITKTQLKRVIKEELEKVLDEGGLGGHNEVVPSKEDQEAAYGMVKNSPAARKAMEAALQDPEVMAAVEAAKAELADQLEEAFSAPRTKISNPRVKKPKWAKDPQARAASEDERDVSNLSLAPQKEDPEGPSWTQRHGMVGAGRAAAGMGGILGGTAAAGYTGLTMAAIPTSFWATTAAAKLTAALAASPALGPLGLAAGLGAMGVGLYLMLDANEQ